VPLPYIIVYGAFVCSAGRYTRRLLSYLSSNIFIQTASTADKRANKAHKTPEFTLRDDLLLCFAASPEPRALFSYPHFICVHYWRGRPSADIEKMLSCVI